MTAKTQQQTIPAHPALEKRTAKRVAWLSWLLDKSIRVPGTNARIGVDGLIGLIPGVGDLIGGLLSTWIVLIAARVGAPTAVLMNMSMNAFIDTALGAIPIVGDLFDLAWQSNEKNLTLLNAYLEDPAEAKKSSTLRVVALGAVMLAVLVGLGALAVWAVGAIAGMFDG